MSPENVTRLKALLIQQEKIKLFPYVDTTGNITIGAGRNLTARGISQEEAVWLLEDDMDNFMAQLPIALPWCAELDDERFSGLVSIAFNMGMHGLLECVQLLDFLKAGKWRQAHDDCLGLLAAKQAPDRYAQIAQIFLNGELPDGYSA